MAPRDMAGTGRYPPHPRFPPLAFYSAIRLSDAEMLSKVMAVDPYFVTQDNGAGAPVHFATTYCRLDMLHHLLNNGAEVNQRDPQGLTPLHRAAHLAHVDGYLELYEYLLSRGADPNIASNDYDPYLSPGPKLPADMAVSDEVVEALRALEHRYAATPKVRAPHPNIGDWWTLYDYGLETIKSWPADYQPDFPEERRKQREKDEKAKKRAALRASKAQFLQALAESGPEAARALMAQVKLSGSTAPLSLPAAAPFTAFLFPGQGSQAIGMLRDTCQLPEVKHMLETANTLLGYDLLQRCLEGPKEVLDATETAQPALFIAGLAAAHRCSKEAGNAAAACRVAAGLSLGEYAALVWAGCMSFENGLKVVKVRAEAMSSAARLGEPHGMLSVVGLTDEDLQQLCRKVLQEVQVPGGTVCQIANYLFPQGRAVSGHTAALTRLADLATASGALKAQMLAVSGAFHTRLMAPASDALAKVLADTPIQAPRVTVLSNVTAEPFPSDPQQIKQLLCKQLMEPVQWEATLKRLIAEGQQGPGGCAQLFELGPGQQIKAMVRRLDQPAWKAFSNVHA